MNLGVDVGDCIQGLHLGFNVDDLDTVVCSESHDGEVFAVILDDGGDDSPYRGATTMMRRATQDCVDAFPAYAGTTVSRAGFEVAAGWPSEESWEQADDRTTLCILRAVDGVLVGSRSGKSPGEPLPPERSMVTLIAGDCFSSTALSAGEGTAAVELVDCETPHTFEVIAFTDAPEHVDFEDVDDFTERSCLELFESYVGNPYDSSALHLRGVPPLAEDWNTSGDRRSFCIVSDPSRDLVRTVRNMNR